MTHGQDAIIQECQVDMQLYGCHLHETVNCHVSSSECINGIMHYSYHGLFIPMTFCTISGLHVPSLDYSYYLYSGLFVLSLDFFVPLFSYHVCQPTALSSVTRVWLRAVTIISVPLIVHENHT